MPLTLLDALWNIASFGYSLTYARVEIIPLSGNDVSAKTFKFGVVNEGMRSICNDAGRQALKWMNNLQASHCKLTHS